MKTVLKLLGTIAASLATGAILGNVFGKAGYSTPVTVALITALYAACNATRKRNLDLDEA